MPRRKRTARSVGGMSTHDIVVLYDWHDGTDSPMPGIIEPLDPFTAKASWPAYREVTWQWWLDTSRDYVRPPTAATIYDGIGRATEDVRWPTYEPPTERVAEAVAADLAALERFRQEHPKEAAGIAEPLREYELAVRLTGELAKATDGDPPAAKEADLQRPPTRIQGRTR